MCIPLLCLLLLFTFKHLLELLNSQVREGLQGIQTANLCCSALSVYHRGLWVNAHCACGLIVLGRVSKMCIFADFICNQQL